MVIPSTIPAARMVKREDGLVLDQGETDAMCVCGIEDIVVRVSANVWSSELQDGLEEIDTV